MILDSIVEQENRFPFGCRCDDTEKTSWKTTVLFLYKVRDIEEKESSTISFIQKKREEKRKTKETPTNYECLTCKRLKWANKQIEKMHQENKKNWYNWCNSTRLINENSKPCLQNGNILIRFSLGTTTDTNVTKIKRINFSLQDINNRFIFFQRI